MNLELRPHQENAVNQLRHGWKLHKTHLVYACVAFGKTALAAYIANGMIKNKKRVIFIAPYTVLVDQTAKRFMEYGLPQPSIIWRDHPWYDPDNLIQIASADTLTRRQMPEVDLIIWDECHIKRKKLLELIRDSDCSTIGLSGTPFAPWLGEYYENLIKPTTMRDMINNGYLSEYEIYAPTKPNLKGVKTNNSASFGYDYRESDLESVMGTAKVAGDIVGFWLKNGENRPTICFSVNVSHANFLTVEFSKSGISAEVMTGETPHEERKKIIERFEAGITKIIVNCAVLVAGFDSDVRCIIYARPTKSEIRWLQCIGRGLRTANGKDKCLVFDHSGTTLSLGAPCSIEYEDLPNNDDGMKDVNQSRKEVEKKEKKPKECPSCKFVKDAGVYICPKCGFKPITGEDVETDESIELESIKGKKKSYSKEEKQRFYSGLLGWQKKGILSGKMIKDGRISHLYKSKFGVWPAKLNKIPKEPDQEVLNFIKYEAIKYAKKLEKQRG